MDGDVMNHVQRMQHLSVWGTHVELQATASIAWDSSKLKFPETELSPTHLGHVELLHVRACHFDVILHEEEGFPLDRPVLEAARLSIKLD